LAGKHGKALSTSFTASYVDLYTSLNPKDRGFFGDLSFVIHRNDSSRLACANFERIATPVANSTSSLPVPTATKTVTVTEDEPTGSAAPNETNVPGGSMSMTVSAASLALVGAVMVFVM